MATGPFSAQIQRAIQWLLGANNTWTGTNTFSAAPVLTTPLGVASGGTGADLSATGGTSQVLQQATAGAAVTVAQLASTNLSDVVAFTTPTYAAGNFTGDSAMTWTVASGDVLTYEYTLIGKMMTLNFALAATTVGGTPSSYLQLAIPASKVAYGYGVGVAVVVDNGGTAAMSNCRTTPGATVIQVLKTPAGANWSAAADATTVQGSITFRIQ